MSSPPIIPAVKRACASSAGSPEASVALPPPASTANAHAAASAASPTAAPDAVGNAMPVLPTISKKERATNRTSAAVLDLEAGSLLPLSPIALSAPLLFPASSTEPAAQTAPVLPPRVLSQLPCAPSVRAARVIAGELVHAAHAAAAIAAAAAPREGFCGVCDLPMPVCVCAAAPDVSQLLPKAATVFLLTQPGEISGKRTTNTGKWLIQAGATLVVVGDSRAENAFLDHILSVPVGSAMVLFPDQASVTVSQFLQSMAECADEAASKGGDESCKGGVGYSAAERVWVTGLTADGSPCAGVETDPASLATAAATAAASAASTASTDTPLLQPLPSGPTPATVVVLDGTWGAARTLLRRVGQLVRARGRQVVGNRADYTRALSLAASGAGAGEDGQQPLPPLLLPTVRLSRSFRGDVGSLRKLGADGHAKPSGVLQAAVDATAVDAAVVAAATAAAASATADAEAVEATSSKAKGGVRAEVESIRGKVSTLHAFTVLAEELWGLGKCHSSADAAASAAADAEADAGAAGEAEAVAEANDAEPHSDRSVGTIVCPALALALAPVSALTPAEPLSADAVAALEARLAHASHARACALSAVSGLLSTLREVVGAFHAHVGGRKRVLLPPEARARAAEAGERLRKAKEEEKEAREKEREVRKAAKIAAKEAAAAAQAAAVGDEGSK